MGGFIRVGGVRRPRRIRKHGFDGAAKLLTSPFDSVVHSNSQWVLRLVPTLFALLVYGAGLGYLARFSRGLSHGLTHGPSH